MDEDNSFLADARDILEIEMSPGLKEAREMLSQAVEFLKERGLRYVLKVCEESESEIHIVCKCSPMPLATAATLLEYEQTRFLKTVDDNKDIIENEDS